ncbi:aldehyde ferredoxin oxidoreductase N-terminal domain-containing protein [Chloroflexota bacterium]
MHGWMDKVLLVDLSNERITQESIESYTGQFLGGRGIASRIYWETVRPETNAFDPENHLILMTGPLVATGAQGATRMLVIGKSPMPYPEGYCFGNMGGFFPAELKKAGFDGVVVKGRASKPVYLWIHDDEAEIRDASTLWGQGAYRSGEMLEEMHNNRTRYITTGVAGEKMVRSAIIFGSHQSTTTAGYGAVMGSKNLKAIAVYGTRKPSVADPEKLLELNRYTMRICKQIWPAGNTIVNSTGHGHLLEFLGRDTCYQCGLECNKRRYRYGGRLEGYRRCQAVEYYLPWRFSREDEPVETFFDAPVLANDYSIGTFELQAMIDWLYACCQSGCLKEQEIGLPLSIIGTREFLEKLLHSIAYREGFGDILAEGLARALEKVSDKARSMIDHDIAPVGRHDLAPPRAMVAHALIYPMEPRVHQGIIHEISRLNVAWNLNQQDSSLSPVTSKVVHDVAKTFWGSEEAGDLSSYDGKALAALKVQNRTYIKDSLGLCDCGWPITYSLTTPDYVGNPDLEANIFSAVTGISGANIEKCGEIIANLQRVIMLREGRKVPEADFPPEFNFTEPLQTTFYVVGSRKLMVPGSGEEGVDVTGNTLDRDKFTSMLKEYYRLRGWDEDTGIPRRETLTTLGLDELSASL